MHNFIVMLLICSIVMSLIALLYMAINPLLSRHFSEKGRYYVWLVILVGLIIPFRPQLGNALVSIEIPNEAAQPIYQIANEHTRSLLANIYFPLSNDAVALTSASQSISFAWGWDWDLEWWQVAFVLWLVGLLVFLSFKLANHYFFVKRVKRWRRDILDEKSSALLCSLKAEMGITKNIGLALFEGIGSPMMLGFVKPKILLPTADFAQDELRFILQHELIHYRRKDLLYKLLVLIATAIHWFNPVMYMIAKAINASCEMSCDAEIVQNADDDMRQQYSETIISVVRYQSKFKTALSTTFYGGRKGMKNRIKSIMTTNKKKVTIGGAILSAALVSVLTIGTLTAFAAERVQPEIETGRPMQAFGRIINGEFVPAPEWEEYFQNADVRIYELDQVTPFDFSLTLQERLERFSGENMELFRIGRDGLLTEWSAEMPLFAFDHLNAMRGMTLDAIGELLGSEVSFLPRTVSFGDTSYDFVRMQGMSPIIGANGEILMFVPQAFFDMTYDEFNELAEQLLTTAVIIQTQETVDILREHWLAAQ